MMMRHGLAVTSSRTRTESVLLVFVESGTVYTILWVGTLFLC